MGDVHLQFHAAAPPATVSLSVAGAAAAGAAAAGAAAAAAAVAVANPSLAAHQHRMILA